MPDHSSTQAPMSHRTLLEVSLIYHELFTPKPKSVPWIIDNLLNYQHRTAAVYVTTSLYDFHERQAGLLEVSGHGGIQAEIQENMWDEVQAKF